MSAFLPFLHSFGELKIWHLLAKLQEQAQDQALPTSSNSGITSAIQVIILDSKEWHFGATAPYIGDFVKHPCYAGSSFGP
jgi:hypothetical protein